MIDYELLAGDYARHRRLHPGVLRALVEGSDIGPGGRILEVGCGTGNYGGALAHAIGAITTGVGCRGFGLDPAAAMLAQAQGAAGGVALSRGRAESLPFANASLDLVFSVDVIHHVQDLPAFYREAWRVLRPGARLCTVTDSEEIIRGRVPLSRYFPDTVAVELGRYPSVETLTVTMAGAGFGAQTSETVESHCWVSSSEPYRTRAYSSLHLISEAALRQGVERLDRDLARGPVEGVVRYVLLWATK
ncbi:MAG: class I SAM-dependent methyltransferase [Anaerolineae bacterium]